MSRILIKRGIILALLLSFVVVPPVQAQVGWLLPVSCEQTGWYHANYTGIIGSGETWHTGIDFGCESKSPVLAPYDGIVYAVYDNWFDYGISAFVYHGLDQYGLPVFTFPTHLSSVVVVPGQFVKQGEVIAFTGSGPPNRSLRPHLHWGASNKPPEWFTTWEEHAQDRLDGRGWFDPLTLGSSITIVQPVTPGMGVVIPEPGDNVVIPETPVVQNLPPGSYWVPQVVNPLSTQMPTTEPVIELPSGSPTWLAALIGRMRFGVFEGVLAFAIIALILVYFLLPREASED